LAAVEAGGHGSEALEPLSAGERATEMLMLGLRLSEGLSLADFAAEVGRPLAETLDARRLAELCTEGFLALDAQRIAATATGRPVLNALLARLLS
jgi:oxygen-independent coproporphyrinogen-3 oxidase